MMHGNRLVPLALTLCLALFAGTLMPVAFGALGPLITADLDISPTQFGVLPTAVFAAGGLGSVLVPRLHRRFGSRTLLGLLGTSSAAGLLAVAAADSYLLLLPPTVLGGLAIALTNPATNDIIRSQVPLDRQGVVTGIKQSGNPLASLIAGAALPSIALAAGWRTAVATTALGGALVLLLGRMYVEPRSAVAAPRLRARAARDPLVIPLARVAFFMGGAVAAVGAYLPLYAYQDVGLTAARSGLLAAGVGLAGLVSRPALGHFAQNVNPGTSLAFIGAGSLVSGALFIAAQQIGGWALVVGALLFGASGVSWMVIAMFAIVRNSVDAAAASGMVQLWFYIGLTAMPLAFGWLVDTTGAFVWGWTAVLITLGLATLSAIRAQALLRTPNPSG